MKGWSSIFVIAGLDPAIPAWALPAAGALQV
jgi:hypothetical protein